MKNTIMKRINALIIIVVLFLSSSLTSFACDEEQTNIYVSKVLFGEDAYSYENNKQLEQLESALFICSEQYNKSGQDKLNDLKKAKVKSLPTLDELNVKELDLFECSHNGWNTESKYNKEAQAERKDVLRQTIVKVFDFGWFNENFKSKSGQIDSFAALLYYTHILADYLADDPADTELSVKGVEVPAYSGNECYELNGGTPKFSTKQKKATKSYKEYSDLDSLGRAGRGISCIGPDTLETAEKRTSLPDPTGWKKGNVFYNEEGLTSNELYNRCHLTARELGGANTLYNLVTGTRYMNEAMIKYENQVADYIRKTGNHVLYRATPIYKGNNLVANVIQLEAYSVEDKGKGIQFNVYCYNVQPGIDISYENGNNELDDKTLNNKDILPFAIINPNDQNPDLMYEISKQLEELFAGQKESAKYKDMMRELQTIADEARNVSGSREYEIYSQLKEKQYDYMNALSKYVPQLLSKEKFFKSAFK